MSCQKKALLIFVRFAIDFAISCSVDICANGSGLSPSWLTDVLKHVDVSLFLRPEVLWMESRGSTAAINMATSHVQKHDSSTTENSVKQTDSGSHANGLYHPFPYKSAYAVPHPSMPACEPQATAFHGWQKGCVDYIWYSSNELEVYILFRIVAIKCELFQVSRILQLPSFQNLQKLGSIPHRVSRTTPSNGYVNCLRSFLALTISTSLLNLIGNLKLLAKPRYFYILMWNWMQQRYF